VIVLLQSAQPGAPVLYGARLSGIDPRSGRFTTGTPEMGLTAIAAVLLARSYGLAADCFGPTSCSRVIDAQFGWQHAVNASLGLLARPRFLSGLADMQSASGTNPESAVIDDEIIGDLRYARAPRAVDAAALDVAVMVEGALRGGYLGTKHTRRFLRAELRRPSVAFVGERREWAETGHASVVDAASERVAAIMANEPLGLSEAQMQEFGEVIARAAADAGLSEWPAPAAVLAACRDVRA
jgi:trimethylamine--corrinoid protein Co-methyltransferase